MSIKRSTYSLDEVLCIHMKDQGGSGILILDVQNRSSKWILKLINEERYDKLSRGKSI